MQALTLRRSVSRWADGRFGGLIVPKVIDAEQRVVDVVMSTESVDRDGDVIRVRGWILDEFKKNPLILFQHNRSGLPIAKALGVKKDAKAKLLRGRVQFAGMDQMHEDAERIFLLVRDGFLNATSVGFMPVERRPIPGVPDEEGRVGFGGIEFLKQILLENSIVTVPANPEALVQRAAKELTSETRSFLERAIERELDAARVREVPFDGWPAELRAGFDERSLEADPEQDEGWGDFRDPSPIEVRETPADPTLDEALLAALKGAAPDGDEGSDDGEDAPQSDAPAAEAAPEAPEAPQAVEVEVEVEVEVDEAPDVVEEPAEAEAPEDVEADHVPTSDAIPAEVAPVAGAGSTLDAKAVSAIMSRLEAIEAAMLSAESGSAPEADPDPEDEKSIEVEIESLLQPVLEALKQAREEALETRAVLSAAVDSLKQYSDELFGDVVEAIHAKQSSTVVTSEAVADPVASVKETPPPAKAFTVDDALSDPGVKQAIADSIRSELATAQGRVD